MSKNRIAKYLKELNQPVAKVAIVSDILRGTVTLSISGQHLIWMWVDDGLICPGAAEPIPIHPLAAEALVMSEIDEFLSLEGVGEDEVIKIDTAGCQLSDIFFHPPFLGEPTYEHVLAKVKLKDLYIKYCDESNDLTEYLIGQAISYGVLDELLSLVNL